MIRARLRAAALAILVATVLAVCSAGVAHADICGGFGPFGSNNCGPADNNTGGGNDTSSDFSSWPPGAGWGSDSGGDDNAPIVLPSP